MLFSLIPTVISPAWSTPLTLVPYADGPVVARATDQTVILWLMHFIPFLRVRCSPETEIIGVDDAEMGEFAYDYVGIENEIGHNPHEELNALNGGREPQHKAATHESSDAEKAATSPA